MFSRISETLIHKIRWVLTILWLGLIASFLYDPVSSILTKPENTWSPLRLSNTCIKVQDQCLSEQPYPLGTTLFWGAIIPISIFILLVFGHEMWRRICPLSFLSQILRSLGWQRQIKREDPKTGKIRYELVKIKPDSWLGKNYSYSNPEQFVRKYGNRKKVNLRTGVWATIVDTIIRGFYQK